MGVTVRHDKFADRMLVEGVDGCGPHLNDAALDRIYLDIDSRFRFRPTWDLFVKVVTDAARRSPFHPVCDYLAGLHWDGVPRLAGRDRKSAVEGTGVSVRVDFGGRLILKKTKNTTYVGDKR